MQVLDLSYNSLSVAQPLRKNQKMDPYDKQSAQIWSECLRKNKALIHVDISHNDLPWIGFFDQVAEALFDNHSLLGLHVKGNQAQIDS